MQLEKARFQADQKRPAMTCAWPRCARQTRAGLWLEKPAPSARGLGWSFHDTGVKCGEGACQGQGRQ
jgi:hypothetical protein